MTRRTKQMHNPKIEAISQWEADTLIAALFTRPTTGGDRNDR